SEADVLVDTAGAAGGLSRTRSEAAYAPEPASLSRISSAKTRGCAHRRCRCAWTKGHATTARRDFNRSLPSHHGVRERRLDWFGAVRRRACLPRLDLARVQNSSFQPQSGRSSVAPSCAVHVAASAAPAGDQEIGQCPTKCSSIRPTRRRPGWLFCAAIVSRNST